MRYLARLMIAAQALAVGAAAYEVDNFTRRDSAISDSLSVLDREANQRISTAIEDTNRQIAEGRFPACSGKFDRGQIHRLSDTLHRELGGGVVGTFENLAGSSKEVERVTVRGDESIYAANSPLQWIRKLFAGAILSVAGIQPSIRLAGHYVGVDKLGHFMDQGSQYFEWIVDRETVEVVNRYGVEQEQGWFGKATTGVKSYGDLSANYSGMQFWSDLFFGKNPILGCENGKYVVRRPFSWKDYVNSSWDEAMNCSEFVSGLQGMVEANLSDLKLKCPVSAEECSIMAERSCSVHYVHPDCLKAANSAGKACTDLPDSVADLLRLLREPVTTDCPPVELPSSGVVVRSPDEDLVRASEDAAKIVKKTLETETSPLGGIQP